MGLVAGLIIRPAKRGVAPGASLPSSEDRDQISGITRGSGSDVCLLTGAVAQLGEHLLCKQGVDGSNPFSSTRNQKTGIRARGIG